MKKRETELDILRLMAMLAVIWVHVGGMETDRLPTSDTDCQWLIFLKSVMTWEIPVYVMISGRFFLDPGRPLPFSKIRKACHRPAGGNAQQHPLFPQPLQCFTGSGRDLSGSRIHQSSVNVKKDYFHSMHGKPHFFSRLPIRSFYK